LVPSFAINITLLYAGDITRLKPRFSTRSPTPLPALKSFEDLDAPTGAKTE